MLDDDARICAAKPEEAERLSGLAWRSMACWGCPPELINEFCASLTQEFLENNLSYLIEDEGGGEILGFYSLEQNSDGQWWMRRHWVVPGHIGTCAGPPVPSRLRDCGDRRRGQIKHTFRSGLRSLLSAYGRGARRNGVKTRGRPLS